MTFKLALVQLLGSSNKVLNIKRAQDLIRKAASNGGLFIKLIKAQVIVLPECFNSPYGTNYFAEYAETMGEVTCKALSEIAKETNTYLIGGSFPEIKEGKFYNTCTIWNRNGGLIGTHRKVHLFDIDIPGKIRFQESEVLSPGNELTLVDTEYGKIGVGICYDIRFPEMAMIAARKGCIAMIYPAAFNMTTGPLHWELLQRARAVDNQIYIAACSPARDENSTYVAWGHSTIVDPSGAVMSTTDEKEGIVEAEIDLELFQKFRDFIPVSKQRRFDVYRDVSADQ
jgi:predicted amidohydrolase